ncbi:MAG: pilin [bacterium]
MIQLLAQNKGAADLIYNGLFNVVPKGLPTPASAGAVQDIVVNIITIALGLLGLAFVLLVMYAGFRWMTSGGNATTIQKAQATIIRASVGIAIILLSLTITQFVFDFLYTQKIETITEIQDQFKKQFCADTDHACCSGFNVLKVDCGRPSSCPATITEAYCQRKFGQDGQQCKSYQLINQAQPDICQTCILEGCSAQYCRADGICAPVPTQEQINQERESSLSDVGGTCLFSDNDCKTGLICRDGRHCTTPGSICDGDDPTFCRSGQKCLYSSCVPCERPDEPGCKQ